MMSRIVQYISLQDTYFCLQSDSSLPNSHLNSSVPLTVSSIKLLNPAVVGWAADGLLVGGEEMRNLIVVAWTATACSGRLKVSDGGDGDCGRDEEPPATEIKCLI
jgi:hypothetical protein